MTIYEIIKEATEEFEVLPAAIQVSLRGDKWVELLRNYDENDKPSTCELSDDKRSFTIHRFHKNGLTLIHVSVDLYHQLKGDEYAHFSGSIDHKFTLCEAENAR